MTKFLRQLITEWRRLEMPVNDETFVIAVSGGADSVSLLLALSALKQKNKLQVEFIVTHFNHALRAKESDKDEAFARRLSEKLGLKFESGLWKSGGLKDLEQAARSARYKFLENIAKKYNAFAILTGHTLDDQAETFLLRLIRGSGPDGLGAMKPVRRLTAGAETMLVRPLLGWARRSDTEQFCRSEKVKYRLDPMNRDEAFLRVHIRRQVLPLLQNINPQIVPNLAKTAELLREEAEAGDLAAQVHLVGALSVSKDTLDLKYLATLPVAMRKRVLRLWLGTLRGDLRRLDMKHLAAIERLVLSGTGGKEVELPGGERAGVSKGRLIFKKTKVEKRPPDN